jgi:hypothetical protein
VIDGCLLLLARTEDPAVRVLMQRAPDRVAHASVEDLCAPGWRYMVGAPEHARARACGRTIDAGRIAAVLCRIGRLSAADMETVHADDREFAAAETTAFLRAWLAQFHGVRCNEPTWMSLAGPRWHPLQWSRLVTDLGIPASVAARESATAVVAGRDVFGTNVPQLIDYAKRIASAVHARSLAIRFVRNGEWCFHSAEACPELDEPNADALLHDLLAGRA